MLSDEKIKELAEKMPRGFLWAEGCEWESGVLIQEATEFARAIEAAVLAEQEKAGPVAYLIEDSNGDGKAIRAKDIDKASLNRLIAVTVTPLYPSHNG